MKMLFKGYDKYTFAFIVTHLHLVLLIRKSRFNVMSLVLRENYNNIKIDVYVMDYDV